MKLSLSKKVLVLSFVPLLFFSSLLLAASSTSTPTLYYSTSCGHCQQVLNYLQGNNARVIKKNIADSRAKDEMNRRGHYQVPVLVVGSQTYTGASQIINYFKYRNNEANY